MQSYLAQALRRAAQPIATRSIVGLQSRFIQLDPKLCFVQPAEVKDRMYELLKKFEVVDKEKLSAANHSAQFAELGLDRYVRYLFQTQQVSSSSSSPCSKTRFVRFIPARPAFFVILRTSCFCCDYFLTWFLCRFFLNYFHSLDTVEFLLTVEDEFKVEIPDEDAENIKTIEDAIKCTSPPSDHLVKIKLPQVFHRIDVFHYSFSSFFSSPHRCCP